MPVNFQNRKKNLCDYIYIKSMKLLFLSSLREVSVCS